MNQSTNQKHTISTVADLIRIVTPENFVALGQDIALWLAEVAAVKTIVATAGGKLGGDAQTNSFEWTDDNSNKVNVDIHIILQPANETH